MMQKTFSRIQKALLKEVKAHYGHRLVSLVVFGSVARGTQKYQSDLDFLIVCDALPKGRGKEPKIAAFVDLMEKEVKEYVNLVIHKDEIAKLAIDKRRMRKIANEHDFFFAEVTLMSEIGKSLGTVLGPRGKVPKPLPPKGNVALLLKSPKNMIRVVLKETPVVHAIAGSQDMSDEDIAENVKTIFNFVKDRLPKGINNIRTTMIKLTMGRPVKIGMK